MASRASSGATSLSGPTGTIIRSPTSRLPASMARRQSPAVLRPGSLSGVIAAMTGICRAVSADSRFECVTERLCLVGRQFDDEPAAAFQRHAHHDPAALLGDLKRTISRPRLHRRHTVSPSCHRAAHDRATPRTPALLTALPQCTDTMPAASHPLPRAAKSHLHQSVSLLSFRSLTLVATITVTTSLRTVRRRN